MAKTLVLFDIDGTLLDSIDIDNSIFKLILYSRFQIKLTDSDFKYFLDKSQGTDSGILYQMLGKDIIIDEYKLLESRFKYFFHRELKKALEDSKEKDIEIKGASNFIRHLIYDKDIMVGIATGSWKQSGLIKLKVLDVNFSLRLYGNSDKFFNKNDILLDVIKRALKLNKAPFNRIIYFGDSIWDYIATKNVNIDFIGVDYKNDNNLRNYGVKSIINDYTNLSNILQIIQ